MWETRAALSRWGKRKACRLCAVAALSLSLAAALIAPTGPASAATVRTNTVSAAALASATTGPLGARAPDVARIWMDYNTFVPESRLSEDIDYDFSAQMVNEMETAAQKTIEKWGKKVENVGKYLAILSSVLTAFALKHPIIATVAAVVAIVSSVLAVVALPLSRWFYVIKQWWNKARKKGSHQKFGFWAKTFEDIENQTYENNYARSCAAKTIKCGSPGFWHLHGTALAVG
jgi:hypothetical protein